MPSDRPTKPHGTTTPASAISGVLGRAGYKASLRRKGEEFGGHRCSWDRHQRLVAVGYRCPDTTPDDAADAEHAEMIGVYAAELTAQGYRVVKSNDRFLYVDPVKGSAMDNPKPTIPEQIEALAWLRKGWNGDNSERAIEAFNTLDNAGLFADLDQERDAIEATQEGT